MANEQHLAILAKGVEVWNGWRDENPGARPDLSNAILSYVVDSWPDLYRAGAILGDMNLLLNDLGFTDLRRANLCRADLSGAILSRADLSGADLSQAILSGTPLNGTLLNGALLCKADLSATYLPGADLREADLRLADLRLADLSYADLRGANLSRADLSVTKLFGADLSGADLREADLSGAKVAWTAFADVDLSTVRGLNTVTHMGRSTLGIDTIYKSGGNIPEVFLRGCGVPDTFIAFMASLVGKPNEFYSCFISYSTKDQDFAERLHSDLQAKGVRCWFAPEDVQGGKKLYEQLEEAIQLHDKLLLILSPHSMESEWVKTEIYNARQQEIKSGRRKLFPVSLAPFEAIRAWKAFDADSGKDMEREIREYFIPDFSNWKDHDAYKKAFDRLLRDLKAESGKDESPD